MSVLPTALLSSSSSSVHIVYIAVWLSFSSHYCTSDLWEHVSECEYCVVDSGHLTLNKQTAVRPLKSDVTAEHRSRDRTCSWALCLCAWWKSYHARLLSVVCVCDSFSFALWIMRQRWNAPVLLHAKFFKEAQLPFFVFCSPSFCRTHSPLMSFGASFVSFLVSFPLSSWQTDPTKASANKQHIRGGIFCLFPSVLNPFLCAKLAASIN